MMILNVGKSIFQYLRKVKLILIHSEKKSLYYWFWAQVFLIAFDLIAIILAAVVASAFVPIIQSHPENIPRIVKEFYDFVGLDISIFKFLFILAGLSGFLILVRSLLSVLVENYFYLKLRFITERLAKQLIEIHFTLPYEKRAKISEIQTYFAVHESLNSLTIYVLGNLISVTAEVTTLTVLLLVLLIWKPLITVVLLLVLSFSIYYSFKYHVKRSRKLTKNFTELNTQSMHDFFRLQKLEADHRLRNSFSEALDDYLLGRSNLSASIVHRQVQFGFPRLILESSIVIGGLLSGVIIWYLMNVAQGLVVMATFMIIGLRVQPSLSKIQNGIQVFSQHRELSGEALRLLTFYLSLEKKTNTQGGITKDLYGGFKVVDLKYSFQDGDILFNGLNFNFPEVGIYLLKGKNGVGKTTLLEIICGLRDLSSGNITLDGQFLIELGAEEISESIAYLQQKPPFANQTITHSLLLESYITEKNAMKLERSFELLRKLDFDLQKYSVDEELDLDSLLSEGEKQKIGLARTLSSKRRLILLDEPTSSLDHLAMRALKELLVQDFSGSFIFIASHDRYFDDVALGEIWI